MGFTFFSCLWLWVKRSGFSPLTPTNLPGTACTQKYTFILPEKKFSLNKSFIMLAVNKCKNKTHMILIIPRETESILWLSFHCPVHTGHLLWSLHSQPDPARHNFAHIWCCRTPNPSWGNQLQAYINHFLSHSTSGTFLLEVEKTWLLSHTPLWCWEATVCVSNTPHRFLEPRFHTIWWEDFSKAVNHQNPEDWWLTGLLSSWIILKLFWEVLLLL